MVHDVVRQGSIGVTHRRVTPSEVTRTAQAQRRATWGCCSGGREASEGSVPVEWP